MSRFFSPRSFCAKCNFLRAHGSRSVTPHGVGARTKPPQSHSVRPFNHQQQRRCTAESNRLGFRRRAKSLVWFCGSAALAVAVGLNYQNDPVNTLSEKLEARPADRYSDAREVSRDLVERIKAEVGAPGVVVGVSVDGSLVWCEGFGYADLENRVPCTPETVMRIASISKPLTAAAAARLREEGKLDLDVPVQKYVPEFPQKQFEGKEVVITPRMLLSHLSGIRHYEKDPNKVREDKEKERRALKAPVLQRDHPKNTDLGKDKPGAEQGGKKKDAQKKKEFEHEEYYLKKKFESVTQALDLFKDDPLIFKPGSTFLYSTHAFTLLSAVMERAAERRFLDLMMSMFHELGMLNTVPDENDPLVYHRSRFYHIDKRGRVVNCPYVDNSYKWAGGGFLSTVGDLLLFGAALLYSYQVAQFQDLPGLLPGFLQPQTAKDLWTPVDRAEASWDKEKLYAQGWQVVEKLQKYGQCRKRRHYVSHTGGAVGASSVLLVLPSEELDQPRGQVPLLPQGVVVSIIANMQSVRLHRTAFKIAHEFDKARSIEM